MSVFFQSLITQSALGLTLAAAAVWSTGCRSESQSSVPATSADRTAAHEQGQQTNAAETDRAADAEIEAALAKLSPADRELATRQQVCPVSGEKLGSMGPPIKVTVSGQDVFICCPGCRESLESDPAKYLAKLGNQP